MVCFMFARLLSCVGCVASAFAWAPCRACGWAVAGLCLFSGPISLWDGLVPSGPIWRLLDRFGALCDGLAPSGTAWRLLRRYGAFWADLAPWVTAWRLLGRFGSFWADLVPWGPAWALCGWVSGVRGWSLVWPVALVAGLCAHGAHMVRACAATWFSIARYPTPYKSGKKHKKSEILKIRFVRGNAAFLLQKSLLKETCAAAAKRRRRNGKRKGF